jgi:hypothetical protein
MTTCKYCGSEIKGQIRKNDTKRGKYCSRDCYYKSRPSKKVTLNCSQCGVSFQRAKWRLTTKPMRRYFCSSKCFGVHKSSNPELYDLCIPPPRNKEKGSRPDLWRGKQLTCEVLEEEYKSGCRLIDIAEKYGIGYSTVSARMKFCNLNTNRTRHYKQNCYSAIRNKIKKERGERCEICGWDKGSCDTHHKKEIVNGGKHSEDNLIILCPNCHRLIHEDKLKV